MKNNLQKEKRMKKKGSAFSHFKNRRSILKCKKAIEMDMLGWWLIGLVALVILIILIMLLRDKGAGALAYIQDLFRFRSAG